MACGVQAAGASAAPVPLIRAASAGGRVGGRGRDVGLVRIGLLHDARGVLLGAAAEVDRLLVPPDGAAALLLGLQRRALGLEFLQEAGGVGFVECHDGIPFLAVVLMPAL